MIRKLFPVLAFVLLQPANGWACSCVEGRSVTKKADDASVVFVAKAIHVEQLEKPNSNEDYEAYPTSYLRTSFKLTELLKGTSGGTLEVFSFLLPGACGYSFTTGEEYLVFAFQKSSGFVSGNHLVTNSCSGNLRLSDAENELEILRGEYNR